MRHFLSIRDISASEIQSLVDWSLRLKADHAEGADRDRLSGKVLGLFFEKPSMRTRVSFECAFAHLGGASVFLSREEVGLGKRESVADFARVISRYVDLLAVRTFSHEILEELARYATCPVINALSDDHHPCQALADVCTIVEHFGRLKRLKIVFVGDGNNVARSVAQAAVLCHMDFVLAAPEGYQFDAQFLAECGRMSRHGSVSVEADPAKAVAGADVVYTDVWASMGQEAERDARLRVFAPYQVNEKLFSLAKPTARFLHCLPAHRDEEVTAGVIDGPQSLIVEQAANRLHAQKALMLWLLGQS